MALAAAFIGFACAANAQQPANPPVGPDFSKVTVKTTDLGHRTYMLEGFGGNVTIAVGDDGVIMVDDQFAPMHDKLKAAIAAITPLPVRYIVNTHHHGDHTGGNALFTKDGAVIVAHENVRKRLAAGTTHNLSLIATPPAAPDMLPAMTYTDAMTLEIKGARRKAHASGERPHRRRHLRAFCRRQCAGDRRHLRQRPLSEQRLHERRQHQGHDRGNRHLSHLRQR